MSSNDSVNDQEILNGFASLHQAMVTGFDAIHSKLSAIARDILRLDSEILNVRNDVSRLEGRMMRGFDEVDERLDGHDRRIAALEAR
jgi:hypothetical protein